MINYFRNIISSEYDQDPGFVRLVRIVLAVSTLLITIIDVAVATKSSSSNVWVSEIVIGGLALLSAISFFLTFYKILWPGKILFPLMFLSAVVFQSIASNGLNDTAMSALPVVVIIATLLSGQRAIPWATFLAVLGVLIIAYADSAGMTNNTVQNADLTDDIVAFILLLCIAATTLNQLMTRLNSALIRSRANEQAQIKSNQELRQLQASLEQRVADRTRDLRIASDVSRQVTRELKLETLLPQLVEKTKEGFDLYYASVFLYNPKTEELLLEVGTGEEGAQMKAEAKSFHISARPSLVAHAARERQYIVLNDVSLSPDHFFNRYLPDTRSEAVFPMVVGDELVGVLDLQAENVERFKESDEQILSTLAEQIAIAVRNAGLYGFQMRVADELRRSDLMKNQFLSSVSHELRTPLNAIINFVEMVALGLVGPVTEEQKELLNNSLESSTHLLQLINDILDISKIQAGKLSLYIEQDVDLYEAMNTVIEIVSPMFNEKHVKLVQDIDNNLPLISGDKRRIRQVLLNLLSNALKFTDKGSVTLSAKLEDTEILFAVIDTGIGIAPEAQSAIFEPFVQTTDGIKLEQGTGLGLPISRSLVQAHGGELWMESQPGEGAAFYFSLPIVVKNETRNI